MYNIVNVSNATELFNLKWLILCYVTFTLINALKVHERTQAIIWEAGIRAKWQGKAKIVRNPVNSLT